MMEKQNNMFRTIEKDAAGDAGVLDDIVDFAAGKMVAGRAKAGLGTDKKEKTGGRA